MAAEASRAVVAVADAFMKLGAEKGAAATQRMMASLYNKKGVPYEAVKISTASAASVKCSMAKEDSLALLETSEGVLSADQLDKADAAALAALKDLGASAGERIKEGQLLPALRASRGARGVLADLGARAGEALALGMVANASLLMGEPRDAVRAANEALGIARELKNKKAEAHALHILMSAEVMKRDLDGAIASAKELAQIGKESGDRRREAAVTAIMAKLHLANDAIPVALKTAEQAVALFKDIGDGAGQISAMSTEYEANLSQGKPLTALKVAKDLVAVSAEKGINKTMQASANLMVADAHAASKDSLEGAMEAVRLFKELGSKEDEAGALVSLANARFAQEKKDADGGLQAAQEALALFKDAGNKGGEALATSCVAIGHMLKESAEDAEKAAREALNTFRDAADAIGETYAITVLKNCKKVGVKPGTARLLFDDSGCAHVEMNENASQESLEAVIAMLHSRSGSASVIVLHLEGCPCAEELQSYAVASGTFLVGLRTLGLPVVCACWGKIAGPAWGLVLASDYRIAATNATFMMPVWGPAETLGDILGPQTAVAMCMQQGPTSALMMLENGIIHQCQRGKEDTRKAASEMAKRIAAFPSLPVRNTMNLMSPAIERYALATARGNVR